MASFWGSLDVGVHAGDALRYLQHERASAARLTVAEVAVAGCVALVHSRDTHR